LDGLDSSISACPGAELEADVELSAFRREFAEASLLIRLLALPWVESASLVASLFGAMLESFLGLTLEESRVVVELRISIERPAALRAVVDLVVLFMIAKMLLNMDRNTNEYRVGWILATGRRQCHLWVIYIYT
jgi:hypothetical protein